ncbi:MAG: hypothetical protein Q8R36_00175 [bacterium]|nr:hypothetical protein [bacterium]
MTWKNLQKPLLIIALFVFVVLSNFVLVGHVAGMQTSDNGGMEGCIFTGETILCKMGIIEHISLWKGMFTAIPQNVSTILALTFLLAAVFVVINYSLHNTRIKQNLVQRLYLFHNPDIKSFNSTRQAFSRGIIHPKIYEFANI